MSSQLESIYSDELILLAETLGEVKTRTEKLEGEFSTHAKPLEAATNALSAALSGIKALQFHVLDNNLGALSARVEEMRKAVDEQVGVIALELKKADETNAAKAGADAEALRFEILALESQLESLVTQFGQQLERVEFAAKEEARKLQLIPGPAGAAGASLNPRGTFIDGEVYNRLDVVSWLGSSYIATVDGVKEKPSKNSNQWQTLASRGGGGAGGVGDFGSLAGVAQINQGGTGQTTRVAALNALLPSQTGATQYMLLTDGSGTVSWGAQPVAGLPSQTSNGGKLLTTNGTTASWSGAVTVSGNDATIAGALTVNGVTPSTFAGVITTTAAAQRITNTGGAFQIYKDATPTKAARFSFNVAATDAVGIGVYDGSSWTDTFRVTTTQALVTTTTASTTTSSGALVVTGGVGVGGAIYAGGIIKGAQSAYVSPTGVVAGAANAAFQVDVENATTRDILVFGDSSRCGLVRGYHDGSGGIRWQFGRYTGTSFDEFLRLQGTTAPNATLTLYGTTDSTTTSSGALVVSGGLGVAKSINAGANGSTHIFTGGDGGSGSTIFALKDNAGTIRVNVDGVGTVGIGVNLVLSGSSNVFRIANAQTPASASATGTAGTICWDTSYIYVCTATNTWKRAAIATW